MTLQIATEGCCKGHLCDNCKTCQKGRCCRRDNPYYELPKFGDWKEAVYGKLGELDDGGETVECHICGERRAHLGRHIIMHDVTPQEYRIYFGLRAKQPLASTKFRMVMSKVAGDLLRSEGEAFRHNIELRITPEQASAKLGGRKQSLTEFAERRGLDVKSALVLYREYLEGAQHKYKQAQHNAEYQRAWRRANPEKFRDTLKRYQQSNKGREKRREYERIARQRRKQGTIKNPSTDQA